jgi:hypothetical protein
MSGANTDVRAFNESRIDKVNNQLDRLGARATGGPVKRGKAYMVGEHRPEVFVLTVPLAAGANPVEHGRQIAQGLKSFLNAGGSVVLTNGTKVLP